MSKQYPGTERHKQQDQAADHVVAETESQAAPPEKGKALDTVLFEQITDSNGGSTTLQ